MYFFVLVLGVNNLEYLVEKVLRISGIFEKRSTKLRKGQSAVEIVNFRFFVGKPPLDYGLKMIAHPKV